MTDDEYVDEFYEDDPWEELGCVLGDKCLHYDPEHTSDECFDLEYIQEYYREGMRETEEYKLGRTEALQEVIEIIQNRINCTGNSFSVPALKHLRQSIKTRISEINQDTLNEA